MVKINPDKCGSVYPNAVLENSGFKKIEQLQDEWGIFTVSVAVKL